jgi:S-adenosylmethionine hydrolase
MFYLSPMNLIWLFLCANRDRLWQVSALLYFLFLCCGIQAGPLVFQSDFGLRDGAVASMKGVAVSVDPGLFIYDITHEIPAYNIWEAALRLEQAAGYWPSGTVFISVVDPGVGSERRSVVLKTRSGQYFVTPDNGTLTFVAESLGVEQVREIDEATNRLKHSGESHTFHGRDVYAYTGARLAAGLISFEQVGQDRGQELVRIPYQRPAEVDGIVSGGIPILDIQYGNVWTNIDQATFQRLGIGSGGKVTVRIFKGEAQVISLDLTYVDTFAGVGKGQPLLYMNSLGNAALAINQGSFAEQFRVASGPEWNIRLSRPDSRPDGSKLAVD